LTGGICSDETIDQPKHEKSDAKTRKRPQIPNFFSKLLAAAARQSGRQWRLRTDHGGERIMRAHLVET
jgi:hypothetical protein